MTSSIDEVLERVDRAVYSAIDALLWTSRYNDASLQTSVELVERIAADWLDFRAKAEAMGFDAEEHRLMAINPAEGDAWDYAAHDFILTRNREGSGFWDGDWHEPWGQRLTDLAHNYSELETYIDDEGAIRLL